ncbi:hypothetical protein IFM89_007215 [Coptis chinensis]|uniref:Uncharacterized protein n=1 Tax=Coptis chinensis TaxID=261450 RepID=A0A835LB91_9MAGN|nr:hypothetical protein IFM89_007215 [Coptis chinensis]
MSIPTTITPTLIWLSDKALLRRFLHRDRSSQISLALTKGEALKLRREFKVVLEVRCYSEWYKLYGFVTMLITTVKEANALSLIVDIGAMGPSRSSRARVASQSQATQPAQDGSGVAKTREPRKKTQNLILKNHLSRGGRKPRIEIVIRKGRHVGTWSQQWITELGVIARYRIPPFAHYWKDVTDDQRKSLHKLVLDVNIHNQYSRSCLVVNHCAGPKSFLRIRADMERMVELQNQRIPEGSNPLNEEEIFDKVLGVRPGYKRGLGHGEAPPSHKRVAGYGHPDVDQLRARAEEAESQLEELRA